MKRITISFLLFLSTHAVFAANDTLVINQLIKSGEQYMMSKPDSGIIVGKGIIQLAKKSGIYTGLIRGYNITGMSYWAKGDFNKGLHYINRMKDAAIKYKDSSAFATALGNTAILYIDMGDRDLGLEFSKKAVSIYNRINEQKNAVHYINNIGWIYEAKEMYDSALTYYKLALSGYKKYYGTNEWLGQNLCNISSVYYHLAIADSALTYAQQAIHESQKHENQKALGHSCIAMSQALKINKKHIEAINYADSALHIAQTNNIQTLTAEAYWLKYNVYKELGEYKLAIENMELNKKWTDSLLNEETKKELDNIKTLLATEKKDKELTISKAANDRKRYYLILATIIVIATSFVAYLIYIRQQLRIKAKNKELELKQKEKQVVALELENQELLNHELNKELLTYTITTAQKNQLLQEINDELNNINGKQQAELRKIKHSVSIAMSTEEDWEEFKLRFEKVHQSFFDQLTKQFPQLSANDLRLCSFIKLNLNSKQVASLLNIAPSSVDISKYRLKKKMRLNKEDNLIELIQNI